MKAYVSTKKAIRHWLLRTLEPCQQVVPLMSESLERRLGLFEHLKLRLHLLVCNWCARYFKQIKFLRQLVRLRVSMPAEDNPAQVVLTADARERIAESLRQAEPQRPLT